MSGRVEAIYLFPKRRAPGRSVREVEARALGLAGDRKRARKRAVTLLAVEDWRAAAAEAATDAPAMARRANVVLSGLALATTIGARLRVGAAVVRVIGENTPCRRMDEVKRGLRRALAPACRAGVFGAVEIGGVVRVGDRVEVEAA